MIQILEILSIGSMKYKVVIIYIDSSGFIDSLDSTDFIDALDSVDSIHTKHWDSCGRA